MTRTRGLVPGEAEALVEVEAEAEVGGEDEEAERVHVVEAESDTTLAVNILVDTGTTITRMIITEIGVPR